MFGQDKDAGTWEGGCVIGKFLGDQKVPFLEMRTFLMRPLPYPKKGDCKEE